ncbi:MAG: hypothetical protein OP8BY_0266 [Candidatus Saccharicenans subterraneus]|uniref:Uncharacterized protein n=1 Tax=Candidatus Saccharicenans subterraneus TaxID=2508984 RepID=A0A3E2BLK4_9BACT|nr:MAG: hypothetical protein OP8BY_0266 [Candidatus Saccharicenans subterraneum]
MKIEAIDFCGVGGDILEKTEMRIKGLSLMILLQLIIGLVPGRCLPVSSFSGLP